MKIAYATLYDAQDVSRGSGWPYYLTREIQRQGHAVHFVNPGAVPFPFMTRLCRFASLKVGKKYRSYQDPFVGRIIARQLNQKLNQLTYNVLLTNDYTIAAYTKQSQPIVLYTDAVFPRNYRQNAHPRLENLSRWSVWFCHHVINQGLQRAHLTLFPSQWGVNEMVAYEGGNKEKMGVIPWGANIADPSPQIAAARRFARIHEKGTIELLFVGKDWQRKGGDIAVQTVEILNQCGVSALLHVVGAQPEYLYDHPQVRLYGFLNKTEPEEQKQIETLFRQCDVFILPSVAEGFGIVFAEAAAYGLPSLAYAIMGVTTAVASGVSGVLLPPGASADDFATVIKSWFNSPQQYEQLVAGARDYYQATVNWSAAATQLCSQIEQIC